MNHKLIFIRWKIRNVLFETSLAFVNRSLYRLLVWIKNSIAALEINYIYLTSQMTNTENWPSRSFLLAVSGNDWHDARYFWTLTVLLPFIKLTCISLLVWYICVWIFYFYINLEKLSKLVKKLIKSLQRNLS